MLGRLEEGKFRQARGARDQPASGRSGLEPEPLDEAGSFCAFFSNPKLGARMSGFLLATSGVRVFQGRLLKEVTTGKLKGRSKT
jgi:hypothetical protein